MSHDTRPRRRISPARLEEVLVILVAAHSYAVGVALLAAPSLSTRLGGWPLVAPLFFPRQAGVFHLLVATAYLVEYRRLRGVTLLVMAKSAATVFLLAHAVLSPGAWLVPFSGVADALMGAAVLAVHRMARSEPDPARGAR